jgi:hypothetical protein
MNSIGPKKVLDQIKGMNYDKLSLLPRFEVFFFFFFKCLLNHLVIILNERMRDTEWKEGSNS